MQTYKQILKQDYDRRQRLNPAYSLRAYSRFLGLSPATLSEIMRDRRKLPRRHADQVAQKLDLSPLEKTVFIKSVNMERKTLKDLCQDRDSFTEAEVLNNQKHYNIISQWEYFAFLNLIETKDFQNSIPWISKRLTISECRAEQIQAELLELGFIEHDNGKIKRTSSHSSLTTTQDIRSKALRSSHKENLQMAMDKIETVPTEDRFYSASTVAINKEKIDEAKMLIREFRQKLCALMEKGEKEEVYNLNIQLYPLTTKVTKQENLP